METGPTEGGQKFAHIPMFDFANPTYLSLVEISGYVSKIRALEERVEKLETENRELREGR